MEWRARDEMCDVSRDLWAGRSKEDGKSIRNSSDTTHDIRNAWMCAELLSLHVSALRSCISTLNFHTDVAYGIWQCW
jgi:hypothetical protein